MSLNLQTFPKAQQTQRVKCSSQTCFDCPPYPPTKKKNCFLEVGIIKIAFLKLESYPLRQTLSRFSITEGGPVWDSSVFLKSVT